MPKISVVIPAYNSGRFLDAAVHSVLDQTFSDWECLIVDDGSAEDLSRLSALDRRVRIIRQDRAGVCIARNRGIVEAAGQYIAFLDHDDAFLPTKLQKQYDAMSSDEGVGLCHTSFAVMDGAGRFDGPNGTPPGNDFLSMLEFGVPFPTTTMVRKSVLSLVGLFDPFLSPSEDADLFLRVAKFSKVVYVPSCEALYRVHGENTSRNYMACLRTIDHLSQRHQIYAQARGDSTTRAAAKRMMAYRRRRVFGPQAYDAARQSLRHGRPVDFAVHLTRAIVWSPRYTLGAIAKYGSQAWVAPPAGRR